MFSWLETALGRIYPTPGYFYAGVFFFFAAIWLGRQAADQWDDWNQARNPITTVHQQFPSPFAQSRQGVRGCLMSILLRFLQILCLLLALDLLFLRGAGTGQLIASF